MSPEAPRVDSYTEASLPKSTQNFVKGKEISAKWWELFECEALNRLVEKGTANNLTFQAAQASLKAAQENLKGVQGSLFPEVNATINISRQKDPFLSTTSAPSNKPYNYFNPALNLSYMFDIFGGIRRQAEAQEAMLEYQSFQLEAAYLTLTTHIVTAAIEEASLRAQIQAQHSLVQQNSKVLEIVKAQLALGSISLVEFFAQEALVAQVKSTLSILEKKLAIVRHSLYILVGSFPGEGDLPIFNLEDLKLPTELPVSLPSELVRQRPDVRATEALLHQASAQIGVSKANLFPQLTLTGFVGSGAYHSNKLFASSTNVWSIGAQLLQPIFQGGTLSAQHRAAVALYEQAFAQYRQTVLEAFQNVADSLKSIVEDSHTFEAQSYAEKSTSASLNLAQQQFQLGAISFIEVLNSEQQYAHTKLNAIVAKAQLYTDSALLFQALGGGWWNRDKKLPFSEEVNDLKGDVTK